MSSITLALSKGRIFEETLPLLAAAGIVPTDNPESSRKLIIGTNRPGVSVVIVRASDVPTYVQYGAADLGIAGRDVLIEHGGAGLYQPLDLNIAKCKMMVAVENGFDYDAAVKHKDQPTVLLIKTAWGGHSLHGHFRSPSSGKPAYDTGEWPKPEDIGQSYHKMVKEVRAALADLGDQKYEIAGFYWQQGYNDMVTPQAIPEYAQLLVNLVSDLRKEFNVPNMPVVVGQLGNGGPVTEGAMFEFRKAQEEGTKQIKNAVFIKTTDFARPAELSPCPGHGHHWFANAESYFLIGEAAGEGMKSLLK